MILYNQDTTKAARQAAQYETEENKMFFNTYCIIMVALILAALAFYIALRVSPRLLDWFDDFIDPVRNLFDKEED